MVGKLEISNSLCHLVGNQQCLESVGFGDNPLQQPGISELDD